MRPLQKLLLLLATTASLAEGFYIPGWSIRTYKDDDPLPLAVNKLTSPSTSLTYAFAEQPFVCPAAKGGWGKRFGGAGITGLNLGEVLRGDRIEISDYELVFGKDETCKVLCEREVDRTGVERAKELVRGGYLVEWIVDNLPGATSFVTVDKTKKYYAAGFKLGFYENEKTFINNHHTIVIRWRNAPNNRDRKLIVAFEVYPKSIAGAGGKCPESLDNQPPLELNIPLASTKDGKAPAGDDGKTMKIPYTYSVYWKEENSIEWASRWDLYFINNDESASVHWLAIINSLVIAMLLTVMMAIVMLRTLSRDIHNYNETGPSGDTEAKVKTSEGADEDDEIMEDITGWKLVHGDVFRSPDMGGLFAPLIGSGVQLLAMAAALIVLSAVGVLNPSYRGGFVSFGLFLFVFAGVFSGYFSTRVYKTFKGDNWRKNALMTALLFPGAIFTVMFILNLFVWAQASSNAIPFGTLVALVAMWLLISLPLVFLGSWYGFKKDPWEHPTRTTVIARQVPAQPWHLRTIPSVLLGGLIPFAVIFIELLFVFKSLWQDKNGYYYMFGFLGVIAVILLVTIVEITIVATYFQLCAENYHWWWRSFLVGGGSAVWIFLYSAWYYITKLQIQGLVSGLLFFSYSFLACAVYGLLTGTVGFLATYAFMRRIYGAIKAD